MKLRVSVLIILFTLIASIGCTEDNGSSTYYISPEGSDDNSGLSRSSAWASIDRVNRETFQPGDVILFKSGGTWHGNLRPMGSGAQDRPITISSYGKGSMPVINIGKDEGSAIRLINQSWWEIIGLEITSGAPPELGVQRMGIFATVEDEGEYIEHIVVRDCYIHDIWGQIGGEKTSVAIRIGRLGWIRETRTVNDIVVENNRIVRYDKVGVRISADSNVVVRGNYFENLGGDAIIVSGAYRGLIEYNVADRTCLRTGDPHLDTGDQSRFEWWPHTAAIWLAACTETIMQFNEVYNTGRQPANGDGMAYDFDFGCKNCILQYNYSRNNAGFLLIMDNTYGNIARYNISQNDTKFRPTHLVSMFCDTTERNLLHNNVFYTDYGTLDIDCYYGDEYGPNRGQGLRDKGKLGANFRNNIFYATGQGRFRIVYSRGDSLNSAEFRKLEDHHDIPPPVPGTRFYNNCYFGPWYKDMPEDPMAIVADPLFAEPGSGGIGLESLAGYKLKPGSPCIDAGVFVDMDSKKDFFENPVKENTMDIGAYEHPAKDQ